MTEDEVRKLRAWRVTVEGFEKGFVIITVASTRARAIYRNICNADDSGYELKWIDFHAVRAKEYDYLIPKEGMFSLPLYRVLELIKARP